MKVAIVHDWLVTYAGAERVTEQIIKIYPDADVFSLVNHLDDNHFLQGCDVTTSFIQNLPFSKLKFRNYLPLMPFAIEQFDLSDYDLIISSSFAFAKGVITGPNQIHISYVHSPIRYAWDLQHQYLNEVGLEKGLKSLIIRTALHYIRNFDYRTSQAVDYYISNSNFISSRIKKLYRRDSQVIFPPVNTVEFELNEGRREEFYVTASRLVPYKKVSLLIEAYNQMPDKQLIVIGDGTEYNRLKTMARDNIQLLGRVDFKTLKYYLSHAKGFVFAGIEDFGITMVEAQACGTPLIALKRGGALDIIDGGIESNNPTGVFIDYQTVDSIIDAVMKFEKSKHLFDPINARMNSEKFSISNFRNSFKNHVLSCLDKNHFSNKIKI